MKENNKIKIFLLADTLDSHCENPVGGAEKQIFAFCHKIDKTKFEVIAGCISKPNRLLNAINQFNIKTVCFGIKRIYSLRGIIAGIKFSHFLKKERIDIVMTYHFGADIWGSIFAAMAGVPVIISNRRDAGFWRKTAHIMAYRLINRFVHKIITVSEAVNEMLLREEGVSQQSIKLIYNGIDLERFSRSVDKAAKRQELDIAQDALVIGCVGNVRPVKGHSYLIDAAHSVVSTFPNAHFLMIGEYQANGWIEDKLNYLQLNDKVQLLGMRNDVSEILSACDICVLPSLSEGLSNALLEYMAAGKPIVATDAGGNAELIQHMVSGLLAKRADSKDLADKIIMLLEDANLREKLSRQAKEDAKSKFSIESMINKYEELFEELIGKRHSAGRKINILHLISSNGFYGAEKVMLQLAKESNCNGTKSWVGALNNAYNSHLEVIEEAWKNRLLAYAFESRGRFNWKTINSLCDFIKDNNINILHTHNYKANLVGLLAAKKAKITIVATLHGYIGNNFKLKLYERLDRFILKYFNKVILVDKSLKKHFNNGSINMEVINNGVNANELPIRSATSPQDKKEIIIGAVGRLSPEKGHKYLIEAFADIIKDYPDSRLLIVGDGILRKELENLCAALRISENVTFTGFQENVTRYYRQMDIYVSCSLVEHFPMAILEAMSFKKAIVATNVGGTQDLIEDKVAGLLVNSGSADEIRKAISTYIGIPSLRKTYGENAHRFVKENYSLEKMANSYKKIYEEVIPAGIPTKQCQATGLAGLTKKIALNILPESTLQRIKKLHYARRLKSSSGMEEIDFKIIRSLVRPGGYVLDIGANIGVYTKLFSELTGPEGKVFSIEPIPATFEILRSNVKALNLKNVELLNCAVSDISGAAIMQVPFYETGGKNFYEAHIVNENPDQRLKQIKVETKNLDTLLTGAAQPISFIKCDTEGYELECLKGAAGIIGRFKPAWLIEISGDPDSPGSRANAAFQILNDYGYTPYWFDGENLRERKTGDKSVNYFFLTLIHLEALTPILACTANSELKI